MDVLFHTFPLASHWLREPHAKDRYSPVSGHVKEILARLGQLPQKPFLLLSPHAEWRTPLLFQNAVSYATDGNNVVFMCKQPLDQIPLCVHGMPHTDASVLKNVKFMYYSSAHELIRYCASVHLQPLHPDTIIVNDLDYFVGQFKEHGPEQALAKLCALLIDAVHFIQEKCGKHCTLIMGLDSKMKSLTSALWRFPIQIAALHGTRAEYHGDCELSLNIDGYNVSCRYKIQDTGLFLSEVNAEKVSPDKLP